MSVTVSDVLTSAYYRRGENSIPNDNNEKARAIYIAGKAYRELLRQNKYWFLIKTSAQSTVDEKDIYDLPTDYREMIEVRYNGYLVYPQSLKTAGNVYKFPPIFSPFPLNELSTYWYYVQGDEIHVVPKSTETPTSYIINSIVVSGTTATATTTAEHGFSNDYYVQIAGAVQDELNGSKRITVASSTTFTYEVVSGTTTETPSATATRNNLELKHWYWPTTSFTATTDTIDIPDQYKDVISAYIFGRLAQGEGERGDAQDGLTEFNDIVKQMNQENFKRLLVNSNSTGL